MIITCPLSVSVTGRKSFTLNLNNYRNAHYQVLNKAKIAYMAEVRWQVAKMREYSKVEVIFTVYPKTKRIFDISNVCSIHEKFLMDCIVTLGKLPDDNWKHVLSSTYKYGSVDKNNPRVEAEIIEVDKWSS